MDLKERLGLWLLCAALGGAMSPAQADHRHAEEEWQEEFWDGPCRVKREFDDGDFKEEIKCPHGHGAFWRPGKWKDEYWERGCRVKVEAKHDEFKKEVECDYDDD
ncbi:hypothetical protein I0D00_15715 [Pseudomonas lalucatii]|uniref:Uncharacterized protein n=1 Tax=Pseudomonas lalucatii TaxID=1424203 RepID=A0ABS5Q4Z1_9PSED|nr:hypothetical protein [Pseudomonas lalucatii]MBS7663376.1 hypothetical protein [Pseudomonas lalucatii]MBS7689873.1 hypothetical protein [Pseudomonas lalucatii]MBS7724991.1 hypothetical protein [Pseudomonas lalucatii]QVM87045.1 hypothetical protein I0D68_16315 [Pseudomonas lalucatii]